jgi:hypothetical protein
MGLKHGNSVWRKIVNGGLWGKYLQPRNFVIYIGQFKFKIVNKQSLTMELRPKREAIFNDLYFRKLFRKQC